MRVTVPAALASLALVAGSALANSDTLAATPPQTKPKPSPLSEWERQCLRRSDQAHVVTFKTADRKRLVGVEMGSGAAGVVLGHQLRSTICEWLPHARRLARGGFRVLAFDFRYQGSSATKPMSTPELARLSRADLDMAAAARFMRTRGASKVVLVGSSMGGTGALVAATQVVPPVSAVVALSPPRAFGRTDAAAAGGRLKVPVLIVAAKDDAGFSAEAQAVFDAIASTDKRLEVAAGSEHGTYLLEGAQGAPVRALFDRYLREKTGRSS